MKERLSLLSNEEVDSQSNAAQGVILDLPQYQQAKRVGIYLSMPTAEVQTGKLVQHALESGKSVFVPYIYAVGDTKPKKKVMDMLLLKSLEDYQGLERDSWGIPKLPREGRELRENAMGGRGLSLSSDGGEGGAAEVDGLDLIVVPAVAFDRELNRMGHGAGFYDHYLSRFCKGEKRAKPFLGAFYHISGETETQADLLPSRTLSCTASHRIGPTRHAGMGLESRRYRRRRWELADFKRYPMSIAFQLPWSGWATHFCSLVIHFLHASSQLVPPQIVRLRFVGGAVLSILILIRMGRSSVVVISFISCVLSRGSE